ncbi:MAG: ribonuclease H-like domain-containing protein [Planctomycetota bacterium]
MGSRDLRSKLRRSFAVASEAEATAPADAASAPQSADLREGLRARLLRASLRREARGPVVVPGCEVTTEHGTFWLRRERYGLDHRHGRHALAALLDLDSVLIPPASESATRLDVRTCSFLDTETTGLSGGAGTTVFLCGVGFLEADAFVLEQVFLRSFADERAGLMHVVDRLAQRPVQVTFAGKSFDRHRLANRMTLHRLPHAMLDPRHLDLLHWARRTWRAELPDTRLRTLEERCLGILRDDDLPGSEAPRAWLDWLRDGSGAVDRVMEHNRLDVLTLATLLVELVRVNNARAG